MDRAILRLLFLCTLGVAGCGGTTAQNHRPLAATCPTSGPGDECTKDADCANNGVCSCAGNTFGWAHATKNSCVPANCHRDADCAAGHSCSPTVSAGCGSFYGVQGFYCHTDTDRCVNDSDCPKQNGAAGYCAYSPQVGYWSCSYGFCAG
jgi:hypothetical protein